MAKKINLSQEERERRSKAMKERIARGEVGPQFGKLGGRPKKKRASEIVAEEARKEAEKIAQVFKDGIDPEQPMKTRLEAANSWTRIEKDEATLQLKEEISVESADRKDLIGFIIQAIQEDAIKQEFQERGFDIEATAEDITEDSEFLALGDSEGDSTSGEGV